MSVILNPAIALLTSGGFMETLYLQLYGNFQNAQDPGVVVDGNDISIRLKNTAYDFALAIATSVSGDPAEGTGGGVLLGYVQKAGSDMTGRLRANNLFEAGANNTSVLSTFFTDGIYGASVIGELRIDGNGLVLSGQKAITYDSITGTLGLDAAIFNMGASAVVSSGSLTFGEAATGVVISPTSIKVAGNDVYHAGNANNSSTDWNTKNAIVGGTLDVTGITTLRSSLKSLYGAEIGFGGTSVLTVGEGLVTLAGNIAISTGYGIKSGAIHLFKVIDTNLSIEAAGGDLLLGGSNTIDIRLLSGIKDSSDTNTLITKFGDAYFPNSFKAAHGNGAVLLSTYHSGVDDEGVFVSKKLRFGTASGAYLSGDETGVSIYSGVTRNYVTAYPGTKISHGVSTSLHAPLNQDSNTAQFATSADFYLFDKPLESKTFIGINGSLTRLTDKTLFFSDNSYLQYITSANALLHNGKSLFNNDLSSEAFSSGFAGYGWGIVKNLVSGNFVQTVDELTVRKKLKVYEFQVQKIAVTNGSLWVSDSFSGDTVTPA